MCAFAGMGKFFWKFCDHWQRIGGSRQFVRLVGHVALSRTLRAGSVRESGFSLVAAAPQRQVHYAGAREQSSELVSAHNGRVARGTRTLVAGGSRGQDAWREDVARADAVEALARTGEHSIDMGACRSARACGSPWSLGVAACSTGFDRRNAITKSRRKS